KSASATCSIGARPALAPDCLIRTGLAVLRHSIEEGAPASSFASRFDQQLDLALDHGHSPGGWATHLDPAAERPETLARGRPAMLGPTRARAGSKSVRARGALASREMV